jgi:hypothetical protein
MPKKSGSTSAKKGKDLEEKVKQVLEGAGYNNVGRGGNISELNPSDFRWHPRIQGRWCEWQPDFAARTACGKILIIECKNVNPNDQGGIYMDAEDLVTRFYDIRNNAQNSEMLFMAVLGEGVDLERGKPGFTALMERDLGVRITNSAGLAELLNNLQ